MISKRDRNRIKKILGKYYADAVLEALHNKGVRNRNGMPHSATMVHNVMNGTPHKEIEAAIYDAVEKQIKLDAQLEERKARLLEQTKTGAATPA